MEAPATVCRRCKAPSEGKRHCPACLQRHAQERLIRKNKRVQQGLCTSCGVPSTPPFKLCVKCRKDRLVYAKDRMVARRSRGACTRCTKPTEQGRGFCPDCLARSRQKYAEETAAGILHATAKRRLERKAAGLCIHCGDLPATEGACSCAPCRETIRLKRMW